MPGAPKVSRVWRTGTHVTDGPPRTATWTRLAPDSASWRRWEIQARKGPRTHRGSPWHPAPGSLLWPAGSGASLVLPQPHPRECEEEGGALNTEPQSVGVWGEAGGSEGLVGGLGEEGPRGVLGKGQEPGQKAWSGAAQPPLPLPPPSEPCAPCTHQPNGTPENLRHGHLLPPAPTPTRHRGFPLEESRQCSLPSGRLPPESEAGRVAPGPSPQGETQQVGAGRWEEQQGPGDLLPAAWAQLPHL